MGNKIARTTQVSASEYYLHDLPSSYNLVLIEVLGRGRFFKSILCKHDEGLVLVKVYFKRGDSLDLKDNERRLSEIREIFRTVQHPHIWPFQFWLETDKAAYLLRQYFFSNLHDRLSTRPFLSLVEKKWLAYQLICAVRQSHEHGVCHGDIKCENVLVTSWNWLYLADFASFKPTYIPHDDPSDFSFFFDTGGRRRCYLAPERFYEHGSEIQAAPDAPLTPSMDIFSIGCVIAELFLEGQPLFELSQLLAYRRGQYDPSQHIEKIQDAGIQKMILHMIQLDPESRMSCEAYLRDYASAVFPSYFSPFLHKFFSCLIPLDSDTRVFRLGGGECDADMPSVPRALARPSSKPMSKHDVKRNPNFKYRTDELNDPAVRLSGVRSLLPLPGGDLLTGGTDLKIRYWDHASPDRSYSVCGPSAKGVGNDEKYDIKSSFGVQVVQETSRRPVEGKLTQKALLAVAATDSGGCHRDSVLALASVKLNQRLLISSSRDGAIKVWK